MQVWLPSPKENVGPKESLGRRLFDRPKLIGAIGQKEVPSLDYRDFEDSGDGKVSLDRLGRYGPEKPVLNYLALRAHAAGERRKPSLEFNGWVSIQKQKLVGSKKMQIDVVSSPEEREELTEIEKNIYHSHVEATPPATLVEGNPFFLYFLALHLKMMFEKHGTILGTPPVQHHEAGQTSGKVDGISG
jgi:hypothetical protein